MTTIKPLSNKDFGCDINNGEYWQSDVIKIDRLKELFAELKKRRLDCDWNPRMFDGDYVVEWNDVEELFGPLVPSANNGSLQKE